MAALRNKSEDKLEDKSDTVEFAASDESPEPPAVTATIKVEDHKLDVDVKDAPKHHDDIDAITDLNDEQLQRVLRGLLEEQARRGRVETRHLQDFDTESLLVLQNELRGELASR